jgi:chromosome segregation ATPase
LRVIEENIVAVEFQLKNQKEQIINVAAANSDFDAIRKQLSDFLSKMDETQGQANKRLLDLEKVVTDISKERDLLSIQTSSLNNETKTISQSNQSINKELSDLKEQNKGYKSEVDTIASLSGQMGRNSELITAAATELVNHAKKIFKNSKIFEDTTGQIKTTYQEFAQTGTEFKSAVVGIDTQISNLSNETKNIAQNNDSIKQEIFGIKEQNNAYKFQTDNIASISGDIVAANEGLSQSIKQLSDVTGGVESLKNKLDAYLKELSSVTDFKAQANTFKKIIGEFEDSSKGLSEKFSNIQSNFEGKLNGMNFSFDSLEKEFSDLGRKVEALKESLQKIKSKIEEEVDRTE